MRKRKRLRTTLEAYTEGIRALAWGKLSEEDRDAIHGLLAALLFYSRGSVHDYDIPVDYEEQVKRELAAYVEEMEDYE